jgi:hypothetical protein
VYNNPINLTDPSGKFVFVPLLIAAGGGALIGGAASGILYAISHPCENLLNSASFWRAVGAGAVGGFVAGLLPIGGSLGAAIVWGMVGGASSATASQLSVNLTTPGANWDDDLVGAAITGAITGGVFGGVGYGIRQWLLAQSNKRPVAEVGRRAYAWGQREGLGTGPEPGKEMHRYAENLLDRFQDIFGNRSLRTEVRYVGQQLWQQGDPIKGSVILDVVEGNPRSPTAIYDYKFNGATLTAERTAEILHVGGFPSNTPIIEVHYP